MCIIGQFKLCNHKSVLFNDTFNAFVENVNFITEDNITNVKLKKDKPDIIINPFLHSCLHSPPSLSLDPHPSSLTPAPPLSLR